MNYASRALAALSGSWIVLVATAGAPPVVESVVRVDAGTKDRPSNETSIVALSSAPTEILGTFNDWRDDDGSGSTVRTGVALTLDNLTWTDFTVRPPSSNRAAVEGDPMTAYDPRTQTLWVGAISFAGNGGLYVAKKKNGSNSFEASVMARKTGGADKCWMAAGTVPGDDTKTNLYIAYNEGVIVSKDLGATWSSSPVGIETGLGFLPRVAPDGTLYVAYWDDSANFKLVRSTDSGVHFSAKKVIAKRVGAWGLYDGPFPSDFRVLPNVCIAVDNLDSATLYAVFPDNVKSSGGNTKVGIYFTKSSDSGDTWSKAVLISGDQSNVKADSFFPWIEMDARGRLHLFYYDTRNKAQNDSDSDIYLDAYYNYSDDRGATWNEIRCTSSVFKYNTGQWWFMGDYIGACSVKGKTYACMAMTDNTHLHSYVISINDPRGDMNCDDSLDFNDIDGFVDAIVSKETYDSMYPGCDYQRGDIDGNGTVDFNDIDSFVTLLVSG